MNMEKQPWASVIVPLYNAQEYVEELVAGLKAQTCPHFEAILVNDGSSDDTQSMVARLVEGDPRFRLLYQQNAGPGSARNVGLAAARGVYALFMDADDAVKPLLVQRVLDAVRGTAWGGGEPLADSPDATADADDPAAANDPAEADGPTKGRTAREPETPGVLEQPRDANSTEGIAALPTSGPDIVCYQVNLYDERDGELHDYEECWDPTRYPRTFDPANHPDTLFNDFRNWPWNKAFRLEFLREHGIRFPAVHRSEDLAFTCAALASASTIALLDECLYTYRVGGQANSTATRDTFASDYFESACALHDYLESKGLLARFGGTYRQWVGLGCFLNLVELNTDEGFATAFEKLACGGLERIGIDADEFEGGDQLAAGRYTNQHAKDVLKAVGAGSAQEARAIADAIHLGFDREDRMRIYREEFGALLGPVLCRATQGMHERKAARAQAKQKGQAQGPRRTEAPDASSTHDASNSSDAPDSSDGSDCPDA